MYTLIEIYWKRILSCASVCVLIIACTHFLIDETFFPEFHSNLIWIQAVFTNVTRERERETGGARLSFRENQSASADRQVERDV